MGQPEILQSPEATTAVRVAKSPIDGVPDELLIAIAVFLRVVSKPKSQWMVATFVSRRWRTVLLSYAPFWKNIDTRNLERTTAYLHRSKMAPLSLTIRSPRCPNAGYHELVSLLSPHVARIQEMRFDSTPEHIQTFFRMLDLKYTMLHSLSLQGIEGQQLVHVSPNAPNLRALEVYGFTTDWSSSIFKDLETLRLDMAFDVRPSLDQLLFILKACPRLEVLLLGEPDFTTARASMDVQLQRLRRLEVTADSQQGVRLMEHLTAPSCQSLRLDFILNDDDRSDENICILPSDWCTRFPVARWVATLHITSDRDEYGNYKHDVLLFDHTGSYNRTVPFSMSLFTMSRAPCPTLLSAITSQLRPYPITSLDLLFTTKYISRTSWQNSLRNLPSLIRLKITAHPCEFNSSLDRLFIALGPDGDALVCPKLKVLYISRLKYASSHPLDILYISLGARMIQGYKLSTLIIESPVWRRRDHPETIVNWPEFGCVVKNYIHSPSCFALRRSPSLNSTAPP
ncbi:hypothetical protein NLI96_g4063 [Meripilus lineatus]|uniref:F-box domain-containing protein n=1 Tax=Meripilus lineatus TaxID=2056292 RepID=A0AAD5YG23_9APHY|nr:hypothetical protein NLI96_g4063 [Physisporinus lineatus]